MADHPNVAKICEAYDAFSRGDLATVGALFAPDIVYHLLGDNRLSGDYKGQAEVFGFFAKMSDMTGRTLRVDVHDILASDEHAVALVTVSAQREGMSFDMREVHVFQLEAGKISAFWAFEENQREGDQFWS